MDVDAVEHEHVEVNVEIERGAEALNQGDSAGLRCAGAPIARIPATL